MKPYANLIIQTSLINQAPDNIQILTLQNLNSPFAKTKTTLLYSQPAHAKEFKQQIFQSQKSLFLKPLTIATHRCDCSKIVVPAYLSGTTNLTQLLEKAHDPNIHATSAFDKAKEMSDSLMHHLQLWNQSNPNWPEVVVPVGGTLLGTLIAWFAIPVLFCEFHKYISWNPLLALLGETTKIPVPYENSMWSALQDPVKYMVVFMAFSQIGPIVVPSISAYLPRLWKGALVMSLVWFLRKWKDNSFSIVMASEADLRIDRSKLALLDKGLSLGLNLIAVMGLSEAFDVGMQSILTFSGVGGVAAAYGGQDMVSNMLSGLTLQFSKPFSVGDSIKAGTIEGEVTEIGLTTTSLTNSENLPVSVPNSVFSSQMIVNKSRAQWHPSLTKITIKIMDIEKIPLITEEIKAALRSNPKVFSGKDAPFCYLSRLEGSVGELTIGCNLRSMRKDELFAAEQDILIEAAKIIRQSGVEV